jgi:uncharacterized protein with NAD-binding domain and iron-sulfur cluster
MEMNNNDLATTVIAELGRQFPDWPAPERHLVIREKRATFDCRADVESLRPGNHTPIQGLWLAGDYTATGLPATLEGAVRSGQQCARSLLRN